MDKIKMRTFRQARCGLGLRQAVVHKDVCMQRDVCGQRLMARRQAGALTSPAEHDEQHNVSRLRRFAGCVQQSRCRTTSLEGNRLDRGEPQARRTNALAAPLGMVGLALACDHTKQRSERCWGAKQRGREGTDRRAGWQ